MNASPGVRVEAADDVDALVDTLIRDPSKADDIKAVLKKRISRPQLIDITAEESVLPSSSDDDDDEGDMWDNVPV